MRTQKNVNPMSTFAMHLSELDVDIRKNPIIQPHLRTQKNVTQMSTSAMQLYQSDVDICNCTKQN